MTASLLDDILGRRAALAEDERKVVQTEAVNSTASLRFTQRRQGRFASRKVPPMSRISGLCARQ